MEINMETEYINGSIKIEAIYSNSKNCKGKYYSPDKELLYEGDMIDEIPCNIENIKIYNDYTYKQYILEKIDNKYNIVKSEYFPQYFMSERLKLLYFEFRSFPFIQTVENQL